MPLTWFAHQAPAIAAKLARPRWFDGTALCIGTMMPDLLYSFSDYAGFDTHQWPGAAAYGLPLTLALTVVTRRVVAPVGAAQLPDLGRYRLRSFAVLAHGRPRALVTLVSAALGIWCHIALDWFTHPGRRGVGWLGYDDVYVRVAGHREPLAGVFQLVGHTFGSLLGALLVLHVGRARLLDRWYGAEAVSRARRWRPTRAQRVTFWCWLAAGGLGGLAWGIPTRSYLVIIERTFVGCLAGTITASGILLAGSRPGTQQWSETRSDTGLRG